VRPRILSLRVRVESIIRRLRGGFLGDCLQRALEMEAVQRAVVLASQAFAAGIPFVIVLSAVAPRGRDLADRLIDRFHLHGSTADQVRALFLSHNDVGGAVTWISVAFLVVSMMNLAGSLQVVYERALSVAHIGLRDRWRSAVWLLGTALYIGEFVQLRPNVSAGGTNIPRLLLSILGSCVYWLWTPRILLGPRRSWRRLVPIAGLTTIAVTMLTIASPLYMPTAIKDNAARFGTIGVAFALLSWLVVLGFLVVGSAVVASQLDRERPLVRDAVGAARRRAAQRPEVESASGSAAAKTPDAPRELGADDNHPEE
jgi:membrane protein